MTAHDDEPVVVRLPFIVACELEEFLANHLNLHDGWELEGEYGIRERRLADAIDAVREGLHPLTLPPEETPPNVIPLRPRGAR